MAYPGGPAAVVQWSLNPASQIGPVEAGFVPEASPFFAVSPFLHYCAAQASRCRLQSLNPKKARFWILLCGLVLHYFIDSA